MRLMSSLEVVVVGDGGTGRQWTDLLTRAKRAQLVGHIPSPDQERSRSSTFSALQQLVSVHPDAAFAVALPPRASVVAIETLTNAGVKCLVQPTGALAFATQPTWTALDWTTLEGPARVRRLLPGAGARRASIEVRGLPASDAASEQDLSLTLLQALALGHFALGGFEPGQIVELTGSLVRLIGEASGMEVELVVRADRVASARVELEASTRVSWQATDDQERLTVRRGDLSRERSWQPAPAAARSLSLLGSESNLPLSQATQTSLARIESLLGHALPPSPAPFAAVSEQLATGRVIEPRLFGFDRASGDESERSEAAGGTAMPAGGTALELALPELPMEIHAFRAGLKPVVFLTLAPADEARVMALVKDAQVIRRERRVETDDQDNWVDVRDRGEPRVELYIGHDRAQVERAAHLQTETDPSHALFELGQLMGYPECCVKAFAGQTDRSNNTANRYFSLARTGPGRPLPWVLNNLFVTLSPFFPCSYDCQRAVRFSETLLAEVERTEPRVYANFARGLRGKFLYLMHGQWLRLSPEGELTRPADLAPELLPLARACAEGDDFELQHDALVLSRAGDEFQRLERADPGLGIQLEFN